MKKIKLLDSWDLNLKGDRWEDDDKRTVLITERNLTQLRDKLHEVIETVNKILDVINIENNP
jgi:hypothetical protein